MIRSLLRYVIYSTLKRNQDILYKHQREIIMWSNKSLSLSPSLVPFLSPISHMQDGWYIIIILVNSLQYEVHIVILYFSAICDGSHKHFIIIHKPMYKTYINFVISMQVIKTVLYN